jgi:hypothetical protein
VVVDNRAPMWCKARRRASGEDELFT